MEENQYLLYRPLAFYPFSTAQTGVNLWTLVRGNCDQTYNAPFYHTTTLCFPQSKQYHSFEQSNFESAPQQNRDIRQISPSLNETGLFSTIHNEPQGFRATTLSPTPMNSVKDSRISGTSRSGRGSKIWRPFSPELDCGASSRKTVNSDTLGVGKDMMCEASSYRVYPTILPSTVTLGESSVFKAVKKKKYQCRYCDQWYLNSGQLAGHIRAHIGSKPYRCEYQGCSRAFARNEELTRHRRIHSGVKPHQCDTCQKRFGRKDHLNKHKKTHMKASEKKIYLCEVPGCKHRYTRSDALTRHLSTAHSIKHQKSNAGKNRQNLLFVPNAKTVH